MCHRDADDSGCGRAAGLPSAVPTASAMTERSFPPGAPAVLDELLSREIVRVLLVEDNPGDAVLVREMLREADSEVVLTVCDRIETAVEPLARGLADLVLLDLSLPDASGLDGLKRLRAAAPEVPVVVLSGLRDEAVALAAVQ